MRLALLAASALALALCGCENLLQSPQSPTDKIVLKAHGGVANQVAKTGDRMVDTVTLISMAVEDPDVRKAVNAKFGSIENHSFGRYFTGPDFAELARTQKVDLAPVVFIDKLTYESGQAFRPNSVVLSADAPDHLYVKFVDAKGHLEMGGNSVNITK